MSYPDPHHPYGGQPPPQGPPPQQQPPYGYPQQPGGYGYPQQQSGGYGHPQQNGFQQPGGYPQQGGYPHQQPGPPPYGHPGHPPGAWGTMPGQVVTARVLLFVAGSIWTLLALISLVVGLTAQRISADLPGGMGDLAAGLAVLFFLLLGGMGALHIVPASMFGKGRTGTRITAIIAASVNALVATLALFGGEGDTNPVLALLWLATAIVTIVFCSLRPASEWFNRPTY
ncbi:hypothetical protein QNO07_04910 [Streptomyces sp. 549]|uniref:hypothetical protein n=1 Tax=Streptomyces sp. 549 TaxID=3049076 RepID=UPI0024C236BA|nr:hypothetical protein [Streptomyces sp. 549]MDK1472774.1 hypothetical protein [Streptomyces sp. 549]